MGEKSKTKLSALHVAEGSNNPVYKLKYFASNATRNLRTGRTNFAMTASSQSKNPRAKDAL